MAIEQKIPSPSEISKTVSPKDIEEIKKLQIDLSQLNSKFGQLYITKMKLETEENLLRKELSLLEKKETNMKISVVGAGAVGASCAEYIAIKDFASEVVLLDIKEGFAEGKAMDLMQTASLNNFDTKITGTTNDYSKTANSSICVVTSGIPRKPGMTREELIGINAGIVKTVTSNLMEL